MATQTQKNLLVTVIKHPFSVSVIILSIVILLVWSDQRSKSTTESSAIGGSTSLNSMNTEPSSSSTPEGITLPGPTVANSGRNQPQIMDQFGSDSGKTAGAAPGLEGLLKGLEAKVQADPTNVGNRVLLAQTYEQLGFSDKALTELRALYEQDKNNDRVNLVLGSLLSKSNKEEELKEAISLLTKIKLEEGRSQYLVYLYQGDAYNQLNQKTQALDNWQKALSQMPETDSHYADLQQRISTLSTK